MQPMTDPVPLFPQPLPEGLDCIVVMPAYNEEGCIGKVLGEWLARLRIILGDRFAVVVVDDGSRDGTGAILDRLVESTPELRVAHQPNGGHGKALMTAYVAALSARPAFVFHVDSDDQFDPIDFEELWQRRDQSDFILGWRRFRQDAPHRVAISHLLRGITRIMLGCYIPDANNPFRLIRASYLDTLLPRVPAGMFAPNIALSVLAACDGKDLLNIPVEHRIRRTGAVSIVRWRLIRACLISLGQLWALRASVRAMRRGRD